MLRRNGQVSMYLNHYQLKLMPFEIGPDPKFLWLGSKHKEAFAMLQYGILESKGFIVIIGEPGTGKSTLLNATVANFGSNIRFAKITDPALDEMDFFNFVADAFGMGKTFQSKAEFLIQLGEFVKDASAQSKKVILVIDEAQRLTPDMLEQIRVFSNVETPGQKVVSCIFAGQTEFLDMVKQNRALAQRVFFSHIIQPLTQSETGDYITHRLKVAGTEDPIFSLAAVQEVFRLSGGNPRLINILCDQALLSGYAFENKKIGPELIKESTEDPLIPLKPYKEPAAETQKQRSAKQSTSTRPIAATTTGPSRIAPAKTDVKAPGRKPAYWVPIALTAVLGLAAYFYLNAGFRAASRVSQTDPGQAQGSAQRAETVPGDSEIGRLQGQMLELRRQKDDAETRLRELQTRFGVLEKDQQELTAAKARVAEFEHAMALKNLDLSATDLKFKEAEKALAQEKSAKDRLIGELSSKEAAIVELQKKLGSAEGEVDTFKKENNRLQAQLAEVNNQRGSAAQGNKLEEAARANGDDLGIAKKLTEGDPSNIQWQRDFLVSYNKIGDVAEAQGKLEEAAQAYGDGLGIARKLAAGDPSNTQWQRVLYVSYIKLGDVAEAQGKPEEAAQAYGDGLGIARKLAAGDPSNTLFKRDLLVSYWKLADLAERQDKAREAQGYWKQAFDVLSGIEKQGLQLSPQDRQDLETLRRKAGAAP
jgi:type II secretory pathway predicted ATPase ExeA/tetratricopeptide (TPR) repeat protein